MHEAAHAVFFPIISLRKFQKFKHKYLENVSMEFRENLATAATCHYLLWTVLTKSLLTLSTYGVAWHLLNFRHYKSMAISAGKFEV